MSLATTEKNLSSQIIANLAATLKGTTESFRLEALSSLETVGLPGNKSEEYKHTPFSRELEKNFTFTGASTANTSVGIDPFKLNIDAYVLVFVNGVFSPSNSRIDEENSALYISNLREALRKPEAIKHFGKYISQKNDPFTLWNAAGWTDGVFIHVPDNTVVDKPILIYHVKDTSAGEVTAVTRNLFVVGRSSEVTVIEKFDSIGSGNSFLNLVNEYSVAENAGLTLYSIQNDSGNSYQYNLTDIHQQRSSRVNTFTFTLNGKLIRNNLQLALDGQNIESHMYGLYLLGKNTLADNHTVVDHREPNSFSNEMYKGIMDESSKGVFNGKIFVRPNAQKTNAFQANRNILLTDKASVNTKPQLEIWADDVKCSHGCTSGQLDEEALFYLRARGLSKETAQAMMLYAFAGELLENVKHPSLREYLDTLVSERLHKNF